MIINQPAFEDLLEIMQLRKAQVPSIEIDYSKLSIDMDALKITPLPLESDRLNEDKIGILDLLGVYFSADRKVIIYDLRIRICARISGIDYQELYDIVLCHELAHAATHLGLDRAGEIWTSFGTETALTLEYFAQIYTFLFYAKNQCDDVTEAMQKLSLTQPYIYQTYLKSIGKDISCINNALLEARHNSVTLQAGRQTAGQNNNSTSISPAGSGSGGICSGGHSQLNAGQNNQLQANLQAQVTPQQQDHWVKVIEAPVPCPTIVWCNRSKRTFELEMKFSIRYNLGKKGPPTLKSIDYPLCGMVYFEPCGTFELEDLVFDFSQPDNFYDYYSDLETFPPVSDCHLNGVKDLSISYSYAIKAVCTLDDFKDIDDYFKAYTSTIKEVIFIQQH